MAPHRPYTPVYTDLNAALRDLGTVWVLRTINGALHKAGKQRAYVASKREQRAIKKLVMR